MNSINWNKRFFASTRGQIVALLRRAARTVNELADALNLTDNAVRAHLSSLERDGIVQQSGVVKGTRKPNYAYNLTAEAEQFFPKAYGTLFNELIAVLATKVPPEQMEELLAEVGERVALGYKGSEQNAEIRDRVKGALEFLGQIGGLAEMEENEGGALIRGYSCPLGSSVIEHPEVCRLAESLLAKIIGAPVKEICDKTGIPHCCFQVSYG